MKTPARLSIRYFLAIVMMSAFATAALADAPAGYYDTVNTSSAELLRSTLNAVIDGHTKIPYTSSATDTWDVLELADEDPYNSGRILDLYQNRVFTKWSTGNTDYNREHSWPKSYGFPDDGSTNFPYTDCHHLFLCDIEYNGDRGSRIFDDCLSSCTVRSTDYYDGQSGSNLYKDLVPIGIWETWDGRKGDVARAMFYMDVRYEGAGVEPDLILTDDPYLILSCQTGDNEDVGYMGLLTTLLQWHEDDPVDSKEISRNDVINIFQGNRNPFIDHPEWVGVVFGDDVVAIDDESCPDLPTSLGGITSIFPNPFNPRAEILFTTSAPGRIQLDIYAVSGRRIRTLVEEFAGSGDHRVQWNGTDDQGHFVAGGSYICRMRSVDGIDSRRLTLLK